MVKVRAKVSKLKLGLGLGELSYGIVEKRNVQNPSTVRFCLFC